MDDVISRQAAINVINRHFGFNIEAEYGSAVQEVINGLPSAQPEITDKQAIEHLQSTGWMQNHDKQMYEMGLKEKLADDSDGYDSLIPSVTPERKNGKWVNGKLIYSDISIATCTTCGKRVPVGNFCIDCGSYNGENERRSND